MKIVRVGNIDIQPDLTGHKLESVRSFRVPELRRGVEALV